MQLLNAKQLEKLKAKTSYWLHRSFDRQIKLAVTGLSRSGKTAFISSLIHQLMNANQGEHLPLFTVVNSERWLGAKLDTQSDLHVPTFPYQQCLDTLLSEEPNWPESTRGLSEIRLAIRFKPSSLIEKKITKLATLYLDIVDYPGEWLLDLPLLNWTYQQWSHYQHTLCSRSPRLELARPWLEALENLRLDQVVPDSELREISHKYTAFLKQTKEQQYGLSVIQPGRFILPGEFENAPILEFFPLANKLPSERDADAWDPNCAYKKLERRFEEYKKSVVTPFYTKFFRNFDRQVVLVDCLDLLNHGYDSFVDAQHAINLILKNFDYGQSSLLRRLFAPKIDRLLFAATKADCVTPDQHHQLKQFLGKMVAHANNDVRFQGVETGFISLASVNCTTVQRVEQERELTTCLRGKRRQDGKNIAIFPGDIPAFVPQAKDWVKERFQFTEFLPPELGPERSVLPHIRMDQFLEYMIGDKF